MSDSERKGLKIVVIGASAAGLRAAARAKRLMPDSVITVVDEGKIISYGACGLSYYLSGDIGNPRALRETTWGTLRDPRFFKDVKGLDVRIRTSATHCDLEKKTIHLKHMITGAEESVAFDKLVLATGAAPFVPPGIPENNPRISTFKTLEDAKTWHSRLETGQLEKVAIIGSGFIGIELAEAFTAMWGAEADLIEMENRILPQMLDEEMSMLVEKHLKENGVRIHKNCRVDKIRDIDNGLAVITDRKSIETEYAIVVVGVRPRIELAQQMGLKIGQSGGIVVDENLKTNHPDVYAAGDCTEIELFYGRHAVLPLGSLANKQGRAVGNQLAGRTTKFGQVAGSSCVKAFDFNCASTGISETQAARYNIPTRAVWGTFGDLADYYPENKTIFMKMVYHAETSQILGLQGVGEGDVVKRVDVMGNLILNKGYIEDLLDLEFAYAPPYSPPLDPLYVLGAAALNQEEGILASSPSLISHEGIILDVRTQSESDSNPVEGALNIPLEELRQRMAEVNKDTPIHIVCPRGSRSPEATRWFFQAGYKNVTYSGGGRLMRSR
ncbi:MAG: FAD-dependent oxidoreductase [Deltaproteobacteria bacterium]|nr:FAD-dependent oxidoreductase [Deltaproteobacteria bacterium]